jgi:hypothetical protein
VGIVTTPYWALEDPGIGYVYHGGPSEHLVKQLVDGLRPQKTNGLSLPTDVVPEIRTFGYDIVVPIGTPKPLAFHSG